MTDNEPAAPKKATAFLAWVLGGPLSDPLTWLIALCILGSLVLSVAGHKTAGWALFGVEVVTIVVRGVPKP